MARLEPGDVSEDEAAAEIAAAVAGEGVHVDRAFTGRANLFAEAAGRAGGRQATPSTRSTASIEAITFATLPAFKPVVAGEMIATVKIIPFAVRARRADKAALAARGASRSCASRPTRSRRSASSRRCCRASPTR